MEHINSPEENRLACHTIVHCFAGAAVVVEPVSTESKNCVRCVLCMPSILYYISLCIHITSSRRSNEYSLLASIACRPYFEFVFMHSRFLHKQTRGLQFFFCFKVFDLFISFIEFHDKRIKNEFTKHLRSIEFMILIELACFGNRVMFGIYVDDLASVGIGT